MEGNPVFNLNWRVNEEKIRGQKKVAMEYAPRLPEFLQPRSVLHSDLYLTTNFFRIHSQENLGMPPTTLLQYKTFPYSTHQEATTIKSV